MADINVTVIDGKIEVDASGTALPTGLILQLIGAAAGTSSDSARAELAAAAAEAFAGGLYDSTAAGIAGTTNGKYFLVRGSGNTFAHLWKNNSGSPSDQFLEIASKAALDNVGNIGLLTGPFGSSTFTTLGQNGLGDANFTRDTAAAGTASARQPLARTLVTGEKVLLFFRLMAGTDGTIVGAPQYRISAGGSGDASAAVSLRTGKLIDYKEITLTASSAHGLVSLSNQKADFRLAMQMFIGAPSNTSPDSSAFQANVIGALKSLADAINVFPMPEQWTAQTRMPVYSAFYGIKGFKVPFYPRQIPYARQRLHQLDVGIISSSANVYGADNRPSVIRFSTTWFEVDPAELTGSNPANRNFYVEVKDPQEANPQNRYVVTVPFYVADATQTGTVTVGHLETSYSANVRPFERNAIEAVGGTYKGVGTLGGGNDKHDGVAGRALSEPLGRNQHDIVPGSTNPYCRVALAGDLAAHPNYCFAVTGGTAGKRPSYAEDPTQGTYYIFDWATWAAAASVNPAQPLVMIVDHWINDVDGSIDWTTQLAADYGYLTDNFVATFPQGHICISLAMPPAADPSDINIGLILQSNQFAPMVKKMMAAFRNRQAERIHLLSTWAHVACDINDIALVGDVLATDSDLGVVTYGMNVSSWVHHYRGNAAQIGWNKAAATCCIYQGKI